MFSSVVNDICALKIKLKLFISQLKRKDLSHIPHSKEQSECVNDYANFTEYIEENHITTGGLYIRFTDFAEKDCVLAFIYPFSFTF